MRYLLPVICLGLCTLFFSSSITTNQFASNALSIGGGEEPILPDDPYNYDDFDFPDHLTETPWGSNDSTVLDVVTDDGATLGRVLFYDEMLSSNENISCATCHKQDLSFADDTRFSEGVNVDTRRNSMQLNDLGWTNRMGFFWDMSQSDLKEMVRLPLQDENEIGLVDLQGVIERMNETNYYPQLFEKAYGSSYINLDRIQEALMQFIAAMTTFNTKFDKAQRGEINFTSEEEHGHMLFEEACGMCHTDGNSFFIDFGIGGPTENIVESAPFLFSNELPIENDDIGYGEINPDLPGLFKAPTLRNIAKTAPYMHDGRFEDLAAVMKYYNEEVEDGEWGVIPEGGFQFEEEDVQSIVAFLNTLSDDQFTTDERFSDPFALSSDTDDATAFLNAPKLYPNPTNSWTALYFDNPSHHKAEVIIRNIQGQLVRKMSTNDEMLNMDVSQLNAGTYIVSININGKLAEQKLSVH